MSREIIVINHKKSYNVTEFEIFYIFPPVTIFLFI